MRKKNIWLSVLVGVLLCCSLYLGIRGAATALDREGEMKEVNRLTWTLHPCDISNDFRYIQYDDRHQVFLADGILDFTGGSEDGRPITEKGESMESLEKYPKLAGLYLKASRRTEEGRKQFGCLRYDGSIAIPFEYDGLEGFAGDYCIAWKTPDLLIIDKNNDILYTAPESSNLKRLSDDTFSVEKQGRTETFRIVKGKIVAAKSDRTMDGEQSGKGDAAGQEGTRIFAKGEKYGLQDEDGKIIVKPVFDNLQFAGSRYLIAVYRGRYGIADVKKLAGRS